MSGAAARWACRLSAGVTMAGLSILGGASAALAADPDGQKSLGQTPPALAWITLNDSRGISMWNYELSLDRGGVMSPDKFFWASVTDYCWGIYRSVVALALWFLDWVLSFSWLQTVASPLLSLGDAMAQVVARLGLPVVFLTINALMAGLWMLRGRRATALWEVGIASVIAALAAGVFAHPVQLLAGPDGLIAGAAETGQQLAAELATGDAAGRTPEQLRQAQTGRLVDTFIRQPTELINFGRILDGTACEGAYNEVVADGPYGTDSQIRDAVGECDSQLGETAAAPSASMAIGSLVFMPAAFVILALGLVLAGSVIAAAVWAMFQALKAVVTLVTGLLPGGGRGSLMLTVAETLVALLVIVFASVFLSAFLLVVQAMFAGSGGDSTPKTFVIVDVLIVAAIVVYLRQHRQLKASSQRLARWLSQRPGAGAGRMPDRPLGAGGMASAGSAMRTAIGIGQMRAARALARNQPTPALAPAGGPAAPTSAGTVPGDRARPGQQRPTGGGSSSTGAPRVVPGEVIREPGPGDPGAAGSRPAGPSGPRQPGSGGARRLPGPARRVAGTLARAGTSAALAYATGGSSTAVQAAAKSARAVQTTRRVALTTRLAAAAITAGPARASQPAAGRGPDRRSGPDRRGVAMRSASPARPAIALPATPITTPAAPAHQAPAAGGSSAPSARPAPHPPSRPLGIEAGDPGSRLRARLASRQQPSRPSTGQ